MDVPRLFRNFLAPDNAIGFSAGDFLELALALVLCLFISSRSRIQSLLRALAERPILSMAVLAALPVALRLALLAHHPIPSPDIYDEFSHLLVADTLRHFRLANPPHTLPQFFETFFTLQGPTYSSIYPIGQGLALAIGRALFGTPWAGVILSVATFCALSYWMLRAWTTPAWALAGGLLAVVEFGPLNEWMNGYWGGAVAATAGCLVFGSLPRLRDSFKVRHAILLGIGLAIHLLTRPYESILLLASVLLFFFPAFRGGPQARALLRSAPFVALAALPAVALTLLQNEQVTRNWTTLPYTLSQYQYGVPASFTTQPNPIPHRQLTREQQLDYKAQRSYHGEEGDTIAKFFLRLEYRVRFYRFFLLAPLYLALLIFIVTVREFRFAWLLLTLCIFALGTNLFPYFYPRYIAGVTCLFVLVSVRGLERLYRLTIRSQPAGKEAARFLLFLCAAHFLLWYGLHLFEGQTFPAIAQYETWDAINHRNPERRIFINAQLTQIPGKLLVFVRYWPNHIFQDEWVYNAADIDNARVVWARDLGPSENEKLLHYYPDRKVWLLEPDAAPPKLSHYSSEAPAPKFLDVP